MGGGRDLGMDLAGGWAVFGILMWAPLEPPSDGGVSLAQLLLEGPPVFLLAAVLGAGSAVSARRRLALGELGGALRAAMLRGLLLALLGLVLGGVADSVWGFLVPLGVALAIASVALLLPTWSVAVLAALLALFGGWVILVSRWSFASLEHVVSLAALAEDPVGTVADVLVTGWYPAITLLTAVLLGIVVARLLERAQRRGARIRMLAGVALAGAALAVLSLGASLLLDRAYAAMLEPGLPPAVARAMWEGWLALQSFGWSLDPFSVHSGPPLAVARMAGLALLAIGLLGVVASVATPRGRALLEPARVVGCGAITASAAIVVATSVGDRLEGVAPWVETALGAVTALCVAVVLLRRGEGPFERAIDALAERAAGGAQPIRGGGSAVGELELVREVQLRAPVGRVWHAMTTPELMLQWMQQPTAPILDAEWDLRAGGSARWRVAEGLATRTYVIEVPAFDPPAAMVQVLRRDDGPVIVTSHDRLFELDGVTTVRTRDVYASRSLRDAAAVATRSRRVANELLAELVEQPPGAIHEAAVR